MIDVFSKYFSILDRKERRRFFLLVILMVFVGIAELIGISSVMLLLRVLTGPEAIIQNRLGNVFYNALGLDTVRAFQIAVAIAVISIFFLSLGVRAAGAYATIQFATMRGYTISVRLLQVYLNRPYSWFLQGNTAEIRKIVLVEVNQLVARVLIPSTRLLSNVITVLFILLFLLIMNPIISVLALGILGGSYGLIYWRLRQPLYRIGRELLEVNRARFQLADEATGGFKEVKLKGAEQAFTQIFRLPARRAAQLSAIQQLVLTLPRFVLEGLSFTGMVMLIFVLYLQTSGNLELLLPTLGVFAFSTMRLLPALQQIFQGVASVRGGKALLHRIHLDLIRAPSEITEALSPFMELRDSMDLHEVNYSYDGAGRPALHRMSLTIPARSTVGLVGGTGAGKTTLVDLMLGLLTPDSGRITIDGSSLSAENLRAWQARIGYVPQSIYLTDDTIYNNIAFGLPPEKIDKAAVERAARMAALHEFVVSELPNGYETVVGERGVRLSGGQRQRIGIARALYSDPDLLVMDEATSALDTLTERAVMDAVKNVQGEKTIILIAHRLTTVRSCDCIYMLESGRIVASGSYDELVAGNELFRQMATGT